MRGLLNSIDFLSGLGVIDVLSWPDAVNVAWGYVPFYAKALTSKDVFADAFGSSMRGSELAHSSSGPPSGAISDGALLARVPEKYKQYSDTISDVLNKMHADGYYAVSTPSVSAAPVSYAPPVSSSGSSFWSFVPQTQQAITSTIQSVAASKSSDITSLIQQRVEAQKQAVWKARMPYIVGIGGLIFVVSIALLASSRE